MLNLSFAVAALLCLLAVAGAFAAGGWWLMRQRGQQRPGRNTPGRADTLRDEVEQIAGIGSFEVDVATGAITLSPKGYSIFGFAPGSALTVQSWLNLTRPEDRADMQAALDACITNKAVFDKTYAITRPVDGQLRWLHGHGAPFFDAKGRAVSFVGTVHDVTDRRTAEFELRLAAAAFDSDIGMLVADASGATFRANRAYSLITGFTLADHYSELSALADVVDKPDEFLAHVREVMREKGQWRGEIEGRRKNGALYPRWVTVKPIRDEHKSVTHYVSTIQDLTEIQLADEKIRHLSFFDQLTGLPNKTLLIDRLKHAMFLGARSGQYGALLHIDLDFFKILNDTNGYEVGDRLLVDVAQRMASLKRESDTVARFSGDEFVMLLETLGEDQDVAAEKAQVVAAKMLQGLNHVFDLGDISHKNSASIGVNLFKGIVKTVDDVLKQAELAMYRAKDEGRNGVQFFEPDMEFSVKQKASLEADLRMGIENGEFELHYQPQVIGQGRVIGAEALLRWTHPRRGVVPPVVFIPIAESCGFIVKLGTWVLEQACAQLALWGNDPRTKDLTIAVNVSAKQFLQTGFEELVLDILAARGANPAHLKLELTESLFVANVDLIVEKMLTLKRHGIGFSLDDFGTGYSSLTYLKRLPLDLLKIDQSFVRDVNDDPHAATIARTIITLAQSLSIDVIAEGVETQKQCDFLCESGCTSYQGYLFGKPLTLVQFVDALQPAAV